MKECWINVYEDGKFGLNLNRQEKHITAITVKRLYRLHVKLKDKPGLVRLYHYRFLLPGAYEVSNKLNENITNYWVSNEPS